MSEENTSEASQYTLPPASFAFPVLPLRAQCESSLGLMDYGQEEKQETKGNLTREEQRMRENSLTEPRLRFVHVSGEIAPSATSAA